MRAITSAWRRVILIIVTLLVLPAGIVAQESDDSGQAYKFSKEELTQMLAPIALYPDALTAQVLMASTYPLEVVEADRWVAKNRQLKGDDLDTALQNKNWDPSVKSLCHFPDLLKSMSDKLDQTRKLGDAFLGQEAEVMATIQELRSKALAQGNLKSTSQQKVVVDNNNVTIEPASPDVIYVPVYDPVSVYGPWWYPDYPPFYWYYPPGYYYGTYIGFGPGIYFGFSAFAWTWFDWPYHRIHVDLSRTRHFHRNYIHQGGSRQWIHNPSHRRGVAYRDIRTSDRFGGRPPRQSSTINQERRGYSPGRGEQPGIRTSQPPAVQRGERAVTQQAPQVRQGPPTGVRSSEGRRDSPFSGVGSGSFERRAGERGGISTGQSPAVRSQSGGFGGGQIQRQDGGGFSGGGGSRGSGLGDGGFRGGGGQGGGSRGGGRR